MYFSRSNGLYHRQGVTVYTERRTADSVIYFISLMNELYYEYWKLIADTHVFQANQKKKLRISTIYITKGFQWNNKWRKNTRNMRFQWKNMTCVCSNIMSALNIGIRNNRSEHLVQLCAENKFIILNTLLQFPEPEGFLHKSSQLIVKLISLRTILVKLSTYCM